MNDVDAFLQRVSAAIAPADGGAAAATQDLLDQKTKPRGSLGRLEELAFRLAGIRGRPLPASFQKALVVMAADHGVAAAGVSAYPQEVTGQMVLNFCRGGAALNVLARQAGARVVVVDMGVKHPVAEATGVRSFPVGPGTRNFLEGPAMTEAEALRALQTGYGLAQELADEGVDLIGLGEMGIGNSTSAAALTAALTGAPAVHVTGRGTGVDDGAWRRKVQVVERALSLHSIHPDDGLGALVAVGGFEIAGLAGLALGAASRRVPVLLDGFIASSAGLVAARLVPRAAGFMLASHLSVEKGHSILLEALGLSPLLDLQLRLGEGTGAALAMHLAEAAARIVTEMATFASAGVADSGA